MAIRESDLWRLLSIILLMLPSTAAQEAHNHGMPEKLGKVSFPISCMPAVQEQVRPRRGSASLLRVHRRRKCISGVWPSRIRSVRWHIGESP